MRVIEKDPDATLDYGFDWSAWLASGETISTVDWTIATGLDEDSLGEVTGSDTAKIWLSGGTAGENYSVACLITTSAGRVDERTLTIRVLER